MQTRLERTAPAEENTTPLRRTWRVAVLLTLIGAAMVAWPRVKAHLQAIAILKLVSGQRVPWLVAKTSAHPVLIGPTQIETSVGTLRARLYMPADLPHAPPLVILHGVHYLGMDEPRLMAFANAMAASGLRVLTPELPDIKDYHVNESSITAIGESARWFAQRTGAPVGVMGLSFSGGLALIAATEPQYAPSIKYIFAVGSQDQMSRVVRYYKTGEDVRPDRTVERLSPHEYGPLVLEYEHLEDFVPVQDIPALRAVLRAHLYENQPEEQQAIATLTSPQRAEAVQLMDARSSTVRTALTASEALHVDEMNALSPHAKIERLKIPVYLLHGEADNIIPAAETLWLAADLPRHTLRAMLISPVISHVEIDNVHPPGLRDQWRLVHFMAQVMEESKK